MPGFIMKCNTHFYLILMAVLLISCPTLLWGQNYGRIKNVKVKGGRFFISADTNYFVKNDSFILIPVNMDYMISRYPPINDADTYKNIRKKASSSKLMKSLYQMTFVDPKTGQATASKQLSNSASPFDAYEGKIIRNIKFTTLEPFGPSLHDTSGVPYTWFGKFGNSVHIKTRSYILRSNLLISSGELIDPLVLADNEVLMRNLPYIDDTRIVIVPIENTDSVDLLFITKDKFSFGINPIIKTASNISIKVWNENLYGLGHRVGGEVSIITNRSPVVHFDAGQYTIQNINGSFIRGDLGYVYIDDQHQYNISFSRGYLPPTINTGLGMSYKRYVFDDYFVDQDSIYIIQDVDLEFQSAYLGHAFNIYDNPDSKLHGIYLTPGFTIINKHYLKRPYVTTEYIGRYRNTIQFLGSISLSQNNFYESNYFFEFGRTENVPYGFILNLTAGLESGEHYNRLYSGFTFSASDYINKFGYLFGEIRIGGYYKDNNLEEGLLKISINHASRLFRFRHSHVRLFSSLWYTMGFDRLPGEFLRFDGDNGIHGFSSNLLIGQERLSFHIEPVVFTPWVFLGFRFVFFGYASFGMIGPGNKAIFDTYLYSGYGLGIRIRNDNLVLNTLELSIGIYPNSPSDQDNLIFNMGGIPTHKFDNFLPNPPGVQAFR
ncbi:MAG: hypothetical protein KAT76_01710 [Bacteroidales bacterium]|nr:hypothetical protein [Bacteroidales bacterium]